MQDIGLNNYNFDRNTQGNFFEGLNPSAFTDVNSILSDIFENFSKLFGAFSGGNNFFQNNPGIQQGGCCTPPIFEDSSHPEGSLKTDGSVITTPGGYKVEATGKFEWTITGPDGKTTRVWGDPHVAEGDGGKWDFKKNSTFVLGDGTKINVTTAPYGKNGMTVTSGLEVISGNDRVTVSGIDKGKGVVGQITQDGYAHANSFNGDVFVMGKETDDWSHQGREIIGSKNGGDSFELGNPLAAGNTRPDINQPMTLMDLFNKYFGDVMNNWNDSWQPNQFGVNPQYSNSFTNPSDQQYSRPQHQQRMQEMFRALSNMFSMLSRLMSLTDQMSAFRNRSVTA